MASSVEAAARTLSVVSAAALPGVTAQRAYVMGISGARSVHSAADSAPVEGVVVPCGQARTSPGQAGYEENAGQ